MKLIKTLTNKISSFFKPFFFFDVVDRKRKIFLIVIYSFLLFSTFISIFFQAPSFIDKGLNNLALLIWPVLLFILIIFDFRSFITSLVKYLFPLSTFILYLIISSCFGIGSFTGSLTRLVFISLILLIIGNMLSSYLPKKSIELVLITYIVASIFLGLLIYFSVLRGADIHSQIYAYGSKNSSAPILFTATIMLFFVGNNKKSIIRTIARFILLAFFVVLIAIMKCRTVLIAMPIIFTIIFIYSKPSPRMVIIVVAAILTAVIVVFAVPQIRTVIIYDILFNNKENQGLDGLLSGRITIILEALSKIQPVLGNGDTYIDCLPIQLLCSYGIIGTLCFLPFNFYPFYILHKYRKTHGANNSFFLLLLLAVLFYFNGIFEGHGQFGPGAKTFSFWLLCGYFDFNSSKNKVDVLASNFSKKVKSNQFSLATYCVCFGIVLLVSVIPSLYSPLSVMAFDKIDSSVIYSEYTPIESLSIEGPTTLCVGQRIKYNASVNPNNATDKQIFWESWGTNQLSIDKDTGEAYAISPGRITLKAYCYDYNIEDRIVITILSQDEYDFSVDEFTISTSSGLTTESMHIGQVVEIVYDKKIFPCSNLITFESTNLDVAEIDDANRVIAKSSGTCSITAKINGGHPVTSNEILIEVDDQLMPIIDSVELGLPEIIYQNIEYDFKPIFYSDHQIVQCDNYVISSSNSGLVVSNGKIRFFNSPDSSLLTVKPVNSTDDAQFTRQINIIANAPQHLIITAPKWITLGDIFSLEVSVFYKNGETRKLDNSEVEATSLRAGKSNPGVVFDNVHFAAIRSGSSHVVLKLKNTNINQRKNFRIYKYSEKEYYSNAKNVIFSFIPLIFSAVALVSLLITFKNNKYKIASLFLFFIISFIPTLPLMLLNHISIGWLFFVNLSISVVLYSVVSFLVVRFKYNGLYLSNIKLQSFQIIKKDGCMTIDI